MSASPIFADRIVNIAVTGSLVRVEFGVMNPPTKKDEKPYLVPAQMVVMPLDGFVASRGAIEAIFKQLVKDGVVKMQPQQTPSVLAEASMADK